VKALSRRQRVAALAGLALLISVVLVYAFRVQVLAWLVMPVSYLAWYVDVVLNTVPQPVYWAVLVLGAVFVAVRALLRNLPPAQDLPLLPQTIRGVSRYRYWLWYLSAIENSTFSNEQTAYILQHLLLDLLAFQEHLSLEETEERVRSGQLEVPSEVAELIITRRLAVPVAPRRSLRTLLQRLQASLHHTDAPLGPAQPANPWIEQIVTFIEDRLELSHEPKP
jgi:hypothetical protein